MNLVLTRDVFGPTWTLGTLTIDGKSFGYVCEDLDRELKQTDALTDIALTKVRGKTAIPSGRFRVLRTWSNRYKRVMMLVADVPGFQGIRIHPGNTSEDTEGCLLPGLHRDIEKGKVSKSTVACNWLDVAVATVLDAGGEVWVTIGYA